MNFRCSTALMNSLQSVSHQTKITLFLIPLFFCSSPKLCSVHQGWEADHEQTSCFQGPGEHSKPKELLNPRQSQVCMTNIGFLQKQIQDEQSIHHPKLCFLHLKSGGTCCQAGKFSPLLLWVPSYMFPFGEGTAENLSVLNSRRHRDQETLLKFSCECEEKSSYMLHNYLLGETSEF